MYKYKLYGAILGDLCGQPFERGVVPKNPVELHNPESHITDDTVMTLATAEALLSGKSAEHCYKIWGKMYPNAGFGKNFKDWIDSPIGTIGTSYGNGCIMRISPFFWVGNACLDKMLALAIDSIRCSHSSDKSYKGFITLWNSYRNIPPAKIYKSQKFDDLRVEADITARFVTNLYWEHRTSYFTTDFIKEAVELGGDTDTNASIIGELSNFHLKDIDKDDVDYVESKLDKYQLEILHKFNKEY